MAQEQVQRQKAKTRTHAEDSNPQVTNSEVSEKTDQVVADIDAVLEDQLDEELLADIDDILEEDALAFVNGFVQQGGE